MQSDAELAELLHAEQRRDDVLPVLVEDEQFPDGLSGQCRVIGLVEVEDLLETGCLEGTIKSN
jgi:hypothetical protein